MVKRLVKSRRSAVTHGRSYGEAREFLDATVGSDLADTGWESSPVDGDRLGMCGSERP